MIEIRETPTRRTVSVSLILQIILYLMYRISVQKKKQVENIEWDFVFEKIEFDAFEVEINVENWIDKGWNII